MTDTTEDRDHDLVSRDCAARASHNGRMAAERVEQRIVTTHQNSLHESFGAAAVKR